MAKNIDNRLKHLERALKFRTSGLVSTQYADGSTEQMGILDLVLKLCSTDERQPVSYEALDEMPSSQLPSVAKQLMEK